MILVARQYDGWSDSPTNTASLDYGLALQNAQAGAVIIHDYVNARLNDPANVVTTRGNITSVLIPTQRLPLNDRGRSSELDAQQPAH